MQEIYVTRRETFAAAHRLHRTDWDEVRNKDVFGKCYNLHGHNFTLKVTVAATVNKETGMVLNFTELKNIVKTHIIDRVDHKYLNEDIAEFKNLLPTSENILLVFRKWLEEQLKDKHYRLHEIRVYESEKNYVSWVAN